MNCPNCNKSIPTVAAIACPFCAADLTVTCEEILRILGLTGQEDHADKVRAHREKKKEIEALIQNAPNRILRERYLAKLLEIEKVGRVLEARGAAADQNDFVQRAKSTAMQPPGLDTNSAHAHPKESLQKNATVGAHGCESTQQPPMPILTEYDRFQPPPLPASDGQHTLRPAPLPFLANRSTSAPTNRRTTFTSNILICAVGFVVLCLTGILIASLVFKKFTTQTFQSQSSQDNGQIMPKEEIEEIMLDSDIKIVTIRSGRGISFVTGGTQIYVVLKDIINSPRIMNAAPKEPVTAQLELLPGRKTILVKQGEINWIEEINIGKRLGFTLLNITPTKIQLRIEKAELSPRGPHWLEENTLDAESIAAIRSAIISCKKTKDSAEGGLKVGNVIISCDKLAEKEKELNELIKNAEHINDSKK